MHPSRQASAAVRLFCFPYAGAGASAFRDRRRDVPGEIEVIGVQLPGRESRFNEPHLVRLADLIAPLRQMVTHLAEKPLFFFGHSLGALVAFELARSLQQDGLPLPFHLVVSATRASHLRSRDDQLHLMPDDELLEKIEEYNETPHALLQNRSLMRFFLPQLRAEFSVCATYEFAPGTRLHCPATAFGGLHDPDVSIDELAAWSAHTTGPFRHQLFDGDHFFIQPHQHAVTGLLSAIATRFLETPLTDRSSARIVEAA